METIQSFGIGVAYVVLGVVVLIIAKIVRDFLTPYKIDEELTTKNNLALGLAMTGYFAGVLIVFLGAVIGPDLEGESFGELFRVICIDFLFALGGIVALNIGRWVVDKFVLTQFSTKKEIIQDRNAGTGAVECGAFIATGLIVAGAIYGEGGESWWTALLSIIVFFVLGQWVLVLFALFYQWITRYDIHAEIERNNVAAGAALGLSMIAIAIIVLKGAAIDFDTDSLSEWADSFLWFAVYTVLGFVLLMILRKVTDVLFLPGTTISHEIATDRNLNAAWIEGVVAIGIATMVFVLL
jgi:uncharacterized membrane protein YjfL (UPF0719 family)